MGLKSDSQIGSLEVLSRREIRSQREMLRMVLVLSTLRIVGTMTRQTIEGLELFRGNGCCRRSRRSRWWCEIIRTRSHDTRRWLRMRRTHR